MSIINQFFLLTEIQIKRNYFDLVMKDVSALLFFLLYFTVNLKHAFLGGLFICDKITIEQQIF